jgi:hypothetical protein
MKSSFIPHSAAFDWWMPNHTAPTPTRATTHQNQSGRMRSATFRALSKAQATVKRARASFHDATAPSMFSGRRRPSRGTRATASRMPRWGRRA